MKNCNYGSIILNKNVYSYGLLNDLNLKIPYINSLNNTICFNTILEIDGDTDDVIKTKLKKLLDFYSVNEDVTIIYLGYSLNLKPIINNLNILLQSDDYSFLNKITILTSEAVLNDFADTNLYSKLGLYSIQFDTIQIIDNTNLIIYYAKIIDSLKYGGNNTFSILKQIPWLTEFIMTSLNCTFNDLSIEFFQPHINKSLNLCNLTKNFATTKLSLWDSQYLRYLVYSFEALSTKLNETLGSCTNCNRSLDDVSMRNFISSLRNQSFDFTTNKMIPYNGRGIFQMINGMFYSNSLNFYNLFDFSSSQSVR